jgi:Zn-finger nucleic acid-binding protein
MDTRPGRDAVTLHCSSCGAPFPSGATKCGHCGASITLEERHLDRLCAACGARMTSSARFCMHCGGAAPLQPVAPASELAPCPRCRGVLRHRSVGASGPLATVVECSACGGLWLAPDALDRLCSDAEAMRAIADQLLAHPPPVAQVEPAKVTYLPCPSCKDRMVRRNFGDTSGVIVDLCRNHGVWLDHAELEKVLAFVRGGGLMRARRREIDRLEREAKDARERRLGLGGALEGGARGPASLGELFDDLRRLFDGPGL